MLFSCNLIFLLKSYLTSWLEISDLKFILSLDMFQDVCAKTWSRSYLDLLCKESISSYWDSAMALIYLLVVSQSLFHWQESSGGEVCMKKNWRRVSYLSCCSWIGPFWVFVVYVCMWMEGMGFWDTGLETNSSQEICTSMLMTLSYPLARNKTYLCYAFICVLSTPISPKL